MEVGDVRDICMEDFFDLVENEGGIYEVETPQGWIEIGSMKREDKECFILRTMSGNSLGAGHDHLVETKNGWEKVEDIDINQSILSTKFGYDAIVAREHLGTRKTFDFEVLSPEHKYYANGIISHNCGKTMTCKWIRQLCQDRHITYRVVTMEDYRKAYSNGNVSRLFEGDRHSKKCVIFFDDMDIMFVDRDKGNAYLTEFLTNLDGIDPREGVVYIFTSNRIEDLDSAFIRPGRVDLFLIFDAPDKELRRRFILERFHKSILGLIDIEDIIVRTEKSEQEDANFPYTFAELEEIRKLLSIDFINRGTVNVEKTFKLFEKHRKEFNERASRMGFASMKSTDPAAPSLDFDYDDDDGSDYYKGFPGLPHMH